MAEVYHNNIIDIDLESGTLFRSFLNHTIGSGDNNANWYGVRVFRKGQPIALSGCSVQGLFMPASGSAILISDGTHTWVSGNEASVLLPQACYNVKGQFTLTIKIIGTNSYSITDTVRIIDGVVADTYSANPVAPTAAVPTYQEILAVYEQMVAAKEGSVRFDIDQTLTAAQMTQARGNIAAASESDVSDLKSALNDKADQATADELSDALKDLLFGNNWDIAGYSIASTGKWFTNSGCSFAVFPVIPNDVLFFKSGSYATIYTFFKSYTAPQHGATPDYATGYSQYTSKGNEFTITVPNDANYLIVAKTNNNDNVYPLWVKSNNYDYTLTNIENYNNCASNIKYINSWPTSGYVNISGAISVSGAWVTTDYYPAQCVKDIILKAYQMPGTVAIASFYDENKIFVYAIDAISGTSGNGEKFGHLDLSGIPETAKYVRFSSNDANHYGIINYNITDVVLRNNKDVVEAKANLIDSNVLITQFNSNGCIKYSDGTISQGANWVYTDYQSAKNVLSIKSRAYQYSTVALVAFYDENKNFLSAVNTYDGQSGNGEKEGTISVSQIPSNAVFMRFSSYASMQNKYVAIKYDYDSALQEITRTVPEIKFEVLNLEKYVNRLYGYPFSMAFIGDSLTYGQTYVHEQGTAGYAYKNKANYPDVFCKMMNIGEKTVIAIPGANPGGVWDQEKTAIGNIQNQFVIVWLGTNGGLTDTVNTDCSGDNVENYANTNTGNYGKIIKTLIDHGNKVFLAQLCYTTHASTSNPVIEKLAERFDCYVITLSAEDIADLNQDKYHTAYNGYVNSVHFNSIGYNHVASVFLSKMMELVYDDPANFEIYLVDE